MLALREQMLVRAAVPPRWLACMCVSALDSGLQCRYWSSGEGEHPAPGRTKANEKTKCRTPSRDRGMEVWKSRRLGATWTPVDVRHDELLSS